MTISPEIIAKEQHIHQGNSFLCSIGGKYAVRIEGNPENKQWERYLSYF